MLEGYEWAAIGAIAAAFIAAIVSLTRLISDRSIKVTEAKLEWLRLLTADVGTFLGEVETLVRLIQHHPENGKQGLASETLEKFRSDHKDRYVSLNTSYHSLLLRLGRKGGVYEWLCKRDEGRRARSNEEPGEQKTTTTRQATGTTKKDIGTTSQETGEAKGEEPEKERSAFYGFLISCFYKDAKRREEGKAALIKLHKEFYKECSEQNLEDIEGAQSEVIYKMLQSFGEEVSNQATSGGWLSAVLRLLLIVLTLVLGALLGAVAIKFLGL